MTSSIYTKSLLAGIAAVALAGAAVAQGSPPNAAIKNAPIAAGQQSSQNTPMGETGVQALMPAAVAVASLYATIILLGDRFDPSSAAIVIVAVLCLVLVQPPREVSSQLTSARVSAVVDVIFRWLILLAILLAIGYVTKSPLQAYPRRVFLTWAAVTPLGLILATLAMQEVMRRFLINAFDSRSAIFAALAQ